MKSSLSVHNSLKRGKEEFKPLVEGRVGLYVCGPTVYSDVHLGNVRTFTSFDVIYRYLMYLGYKVRYVRNITDVGHLVGDVDDTDAEDKLAKQARLEQLEPMEVAQKYTNGFHDMMRVFNNLPPSIEPTATGHIPEQIQMVQDILDNGYAYEANGSVYFDTPKFIAEKGTYGKISGRIVEDLISDTRDNLKNQSEKRHPSDFAIWMKAADNHLMHWQSPWSEGFPGWHLECSAMSTKYLGRTFDIHGGGNDLKFPHHENEVAQNSAACDCEGARYWLHTNMLLMNGRKMSKSDGNTITPQQLFSGESKHITKGYSPMAIRYFMLQAHYRSTLDITDAGLQAAEKGYRKLMEANAVLQKLEYAGKDAIVEADEKAVLESIQGMHDSMSDDFNTAKTIARMMELSSYIYKFQNKQLSINVISKVTFEQLQVVFKEFIYDVFGLKDELAEASGGNSEVLDGLMGLVIDMRNHARANKDWGTADKIRDTLKELQIQLKDGKEGTTWSIE
ncbi:MAG: cysteine--tRNA ligase [Bacteroidota bacterium]